MGKLRRLADKVLLRYLLASAIALGADLGSFLALIALAVPATAAAALGYSLGIVVHWLLSSRAVFSQGVAASGPQRTWQKAMFVGSALFGLAITTVVVGTASTLGTDPRIAKLVAVVVSFAATWLLRERVIFRTRSAR
ncbi:MAG: GtrA family protein [Novosphingobium sp.]|uniref:GtrA family protein n=1 Tax=Novosphingobium sp. TaxID=1874826 RepID=UPI001DACCDAC|nr:GtrA family protein [Novosphingobium sp.]MCB2057883.1 GtrA family protein [Novosphingobium sp.]MCP5386301.1 GtrA family protein [Novosphingobium sp.]